MHEIKFLQQPIRLIRDSYQKRIIEDGSTYFQFEFENRSHSIQWSDLQLTYFFSFDCLSDSNLSANNAEGDSGHEEHHTIKPQFFTETGNCSMEICHDMNNLNSKCWINFRWSYIIPKAGEEEAAPIATDKLEIYSEGLSTSEIIGNLVAEDDGDTTMNVQDTTDSIEIWSRRKDEQFMSKCAAIDKSTGWLISFSDIHGEEILAEPMCPNLSRAATDNDRAGIDRMNSKSSEPISTISYRVMISPDVNSFVHQQSRDNAKMGSSSPQGHHRTSFLSQKLLVSLEKYRH